MIGYSFINSFKMRLFVRIVQTENLRHDSSAGRGLRRGLWDCVKVLTLNEIRDSSLPFG